MVVFKEVIYSILSVTIIVPSYDMFIENQFITYIEEKLSSLSEGVIAFISQSYFLKLITWF